MEAIQKREAWNKGKLVGQKPPVAVKLTEEQRFAQPRPEALIGWPPARQREGSGHAF